MPQLVLALMLLTVLGMAFGQETRRDVNSPAVPHAYAISGQFERIVIIRLEYQAGVGTCRYFGSMAITHRFVAP